MPMAIALSSESAIADFSDCAMTSFRLDPYLWLHLAGLAAVPLWLFVAWLGIAAGYPIAPTLVEIILLVSVGIVPILWMQWQRPFSPFCLLLLSLQPSQLSLEQRKILQRLQGNRTRILAGLGVVPMIWVIGQLYTLAPLAQGATPIPNHFLGLGVAAIALLAANLFWQVPLSVVGILLTGQSQFDATEPYPVAEISPAFTSPGFPVQTLLPVVPSAKPPVSAPAAVDSPAATPADPEPDRDEPADTPPTLEPSESVAPVEPSTAVETSVAAPVMAEQPSAAEDDSPPAIDVVAAADPPTTDSNTDEAASTEAEAATDESTSSTDPPTAAE